ncbi:hypothetical protein OIO90_002164 [Microbotryomycetes sp. JL221]|nr:hypothetical protein OIO90_002164 [Microbotryomycetes sp. JL221]
MMDEDVDPFKPTHTQWVTLYTLLIFLVTLSISWNLKYARTVIYTGKLLTVAFHEGCHALATVLTGGKVNSIQLDPNMGGVTSMDGGWLFLSVRILPAGYIGSTFIGASLIFASFDQKASKIACFPVWAMMLFVMWCARKDMFVLCHVTFSLGMTLALFIIAHGVFLRFFVMYIGVMNVMYTVWDILDDLVFQKFAESDCSAFARRYPWMPSQAWGTVWFAIAFCGLLAGVLGGLTLFKDDFSSQLKNAQTFLPT